MRRLLTCITAASVSLFATSAEARKYCKKQRCRYESVCCQPVSTQHGYLGETSFGVHRFEDLSHANETRHWPGESVDFNGKVDDHSKIEIHAAGGSIAFNSTPGFLTEGSKIDNHSRLLLEAQTFIFRAKIYNHSMLFLIIANEGSFSSTDVLGDNSTIYWRRADLTNPKRPSFNLNRQEPSTTTQEINDQVQWDNIVKTLFTDWKQN